MKAGYIVGNRLYETICYFDKWSKPKSRPGSWDQSKLLVRNFETQEQIGIKIPFRLHPSTKYQELNAEELKKSKERKAWEVFSLWVRLEASNDSGICDCFTCNTSDFYDNMDCGHYIDRRYKSTMFDLINNHPQCKTCNRTKDGNLATYIEKLRYKYGEEAVEELEAKKHQHPDYTYEEIYQEYSKKLKELKRGRFRHIFFPRAK